MPTYISVVDGIGYDDMKANGPNPGVLPGHKLKWLGQTGNTASGSVADQGIGTVALPPIAAGATGSITITDARITAASLIFVSVKDGPTPDTAAGRGVVAWAKAPTMGQVVVNYTPLATMANAWALHYWVVN
jgi:hypothetical protein